MTIGERIRALRDHFGLSQEDFGSELDVTSATISRWESDKVTIPSRMRNSIARRFNCSRHWLDDEKGEMFVYAQQNSNHSLGEPARGYDSGTIKVSVPKEIGGLIEIAAKILSSSNEILKEALTSNLVAFELALKSGDQIQELKSVIEMQGRRIEAMEQILHPSDPVTDAKEQ